MGNIKESQGRCTLSNEAVTIRMVTMTYQNGMEACNTYCCSEEKHCKYSASCNKSSLNRIPLTEALNPTIKHEF